MKKIFLLLGAAFNAGIGMAQEVTSYNVSAFDNYSSLDVANKQTAAATIKQVGVVFPGFTVATDKLSGMARDIYGKTLAVPGATTTEKAVYLMDNQLKSLGVNTADWKLATETTATHAAFTYYEQEVAGHKVVFSRLSFRFTPAGELQRVMMDNYGQPDLNITARMDRNAILAAPVMTTDLAGIDVTTKTVENKWVWFPVPTNSGYQLKAAWPFSIWGTDKVKDMPVNYNGYIDAETGTILYSTNDVTDNLNLLVKGTVYKNSFAPPTSDEPLPNLTIGSSFTDALGVYVSSTNPTQNVTLSLTGKWSVVKTTSTPNTPAFPYAITHPVDSFLFDGGTISKTNQVNAYYHVNRVHDYVTGMIPDLATSTNGVDIALATNVDVANAVGCNAFYNNRTINFYAANSSCNDFALIGDIVYHEYGHFATDMMYKQKKNSGMRNGGLNEGCSDVWAMSITHDPVLGKNAFKNGTNIRTYNNTPKAYPVDITGEVHANGEVIAGAWWDVAVNIGSADTMSMLFAKTYYDLPDGPEGTEGDVYHQVLVSALINDDNDANLNNGTPHFNQIVSAFARHGIYLFGVATLDHKELAHQQPGQPIPVSANLTATAAQKDAPAFLSLKLVYRNRATGIWDSVAMNNAGAGTSGGINFDSQIPAQPVGAIVDYYFVSYDVNGNGAYTFPTGFNTVMPLAQVTLPYQFGVGIYATNVRYDFENVDPNWQIGNNTGDNATSGKWEQNAPMATYWTPSKPYDTLHFVDQPGNDHTSGSGKCLVTGATAGSDYNANDVDNGRTTVISPLLDLTGFTYPIIEYYRWYGNERGGRDTNPRNDMFQAQVRDQNSSIWKTVDGTFQSDYAWRRRIFALADYWPTSKYVYLRFVAADDVFSTVSNNGQGNVEAAVDDVFVYDIFPTSVTNKPAPVKMEVYPNPANDVLSVKMSEGADGTLSIADLTGRTLQAQAISTNVSAYSFNTSAMPAGTYLMMIKTNTSVQVHKIVIAH